MTVRGSTLLLFGTLVASMSPRVATAARTEGTRAAAAVAGRV